MVELDFKDDHREKVCERGIFLCNKSVPWNQEKGFLGPQLGCFSMIFKPYRLGSIVYHGIALIFGYYFLPEVFVCWREAAVSRWCPSAHQRLKIWIIGHFNFNSLLFCFFWFTTGMFYVFWKRLSPGRPTLSSFSIYALRSCTAIDYILYKVHLLSDILKLLRKCISFFVCWNEWRFGIL